VNVILSPNVTAVPANALPSTFTPDSRVFAAVEARIVPLKTEFASIVAAVPTA